MSLALFITILLLAASNGANDNFKGVAALYSARIARYWTCLGWASVTTLAGSLCSALLTSALLHEFTGAGLVPADVATHVQFALAVAGGAALTVAISSRLGLPISTTHALVGAMCGAGLLAAGSQMRLSTLGSTFLLPLLATPLIAIVPAWLLSWPMRRLNALIAETPECICDVEHLALASSATTQILARSSLIEGTNRDCRIHGLRRRHLRTDSRGVAEALLFLSGGAASFARGLNDTPKIAALLLPIAALDTNTAVLAVGLAMFAGGLIGASRVACTMGERITSLDPGTALSASLTTSLLVTTASFNGLPVSTTHVSVGALVGAGANGSSTVNRKTVRNIALSWVVTLPVGAVFAACLLSLLRLSCQ